ncbi:MAG: InlB B-repeat-containing protein [Bacteroidaceae bacterium]|nr:InlB B-repeat-containing protein [Bacteroidaceae bacterium]
MAAEPTSAMEGETVTLTATPAAGYELSALTVTNNSTSAAIATSGTGNSRTFTMPAAAVTVTPTFALQKGSVGNPYTVAEVTTFITGGGTGNKYTRGIVSQAGTSVSDGKMTYYISDDGTTTNQLMIYGGKNLGNTDFTATTDLKVGDRVVIYGPVTYYKSTTPEYTTGNYVYSLSRDFTLTLDGMTNGSAAVQVNGVAQVPNGDGEVTVASGATVTLTATPEDGYAFGKWTSTNDAENNSTDNPLVFTMPFDDVLVGATFADASVKYDIIVDDAVPGGTIEADVAEAKAGATVTLTATPSSGYVFDSWDVQDESSNTVTVTSNQFTMPASAVTVTATFLPVYTVNYYIGGVKNTTTRVSGEELNLDAPSTGFAGWSTANSAASPVFMANDAAVTSNLDVYAVFYESYSADYRLVEADQTDWRGDYLIAYSSSIFADGRKGGTDSKCIGAYGVSVNPGDSLSGKVVDLEWGDKYKVTLEAINDSKLSDGYVLKTKDGKYNYYTSNNNGLSSTATKATAANYPITITFTSSSDVKLKLGGDANGAVFRYNTSGYFRYYKNGGQSAVYLYKRTLNATYSLDVHETISIGSAGYATYCSSNALDFSGTSVKVYQAKATASNVTLTEVEDGIIPAGKGMVLKASADTYYVPVTTASASDYVDAENELVGVLTKTQVDETSGGKYNYILANGSAGVGFYKAVDGKYLAANRAYLSTATPAAAASVKEFLGFTDDDTDAISQIENETMRNEAIYDLSGRRIQKPTKGLYIVNGKKYIKK